LSAETIPAPWYVKPLSPATNNSYVRRKGSEILMDRDHETVEAVWIKVNMDFELVTKVSRIIAEWCEWPNNLFMPDDKCSILFQDIGCDLTIVEVMRQIEEEIVPNLNQNVWSKLGSISYGELIGYIQKMLKN
jgi:hypothetical protein